MTKPKVLFIGDLNKSLPEYQEFSKKYECIEYTLTTTDKIVDDFQTKFSDVEAIYGAWLGFVLQGGFKDQLLEKCPSSLKVISVCSVGYDAYDGDNMAKKGIALTNVPSIGAAEPVSDLVLYNTLSSFRNFKIFHDNMTPSLDHTVKIRKQLDGQEFDHEAGKAKLEDSNGYSFGQFVSGRGCFNPRGHNVVIVGFGRIGQRIGLKLSNIGMNIHYVKRNKLDKEQEDELPYSVQYHSSLNDVKDIADLIVLVAPGTPETYHMINDDIINTFSKPFRIINVGRGTIINEGALVKGLKLGKVLFAGLDVFENEPKIHPELYNRSDVVLTPHIGASTIENFDETAKVAMKNIDDILSGGQGLNRVN